MSGQKGPGGYWSAANPVPTIQKFAETLDRDKKERDRQIDEANKRKAEEEKRKPHEQNEQQEQQQQESDAVPHKKVDAGKLRRREVTDPTTGKDIEIDDVGKEYMQAAKKQELSVPNANLGLPTSVKTDSSQDFPEYRHNQDITAPPDPVAEGTTSDVPIHGEKTNILFHPTPSVSFEPMFKIIEKRAAIVCIAMFLTILVGGRIVGGSIKGMLLLAVCLSSAVWLWMQDLVRRGRAQEWSSEKLRGKTASANLLPESVEWINSFMDILWGLIDPEMFAGVGDTIEDIMQASVPSVIENVRVAEMDQGSNPFRILSLRALPDGESQELIDAMRSHQSETMPEQEVRAREEGGGHYNIECSFAYHAKPGTTSSARAANMHMLVVFYLGIKGLFGVPFPVFTELIEFVATVRLRLQLSPQPPFAKSVTFSLIGLPHVRAGCTPMFRTGLNILNLPLISNFVNYAVSAAANMYVAPKSMTLDLEMMLQGDDVQKDTLAMGIMWVKINRAVELSKQDARGSYGGGSDPYINLSFSKYGKPMYCTRIITDDLNPVWNESAALLVNPELIKADEQLSVELWDSDRNTADDMVGKIEISMQKMLDHPGQMFPLESSLQGLHAGTEMPGKLHWEVGYFAKPRFRAALRTDGKDPNLPQHMKDDPALQDETGNILNEDQDAAVHTPPDPLWPSGICSIVVHQIVNLQLANNKGTLKNRKNNMYGPAASYGENTEESGQDLPTSYCNIQLNDQLVYRTRAKAVSSKPIFNAGTERFVRDWKSAIITVSVRDQRHREHDPIIGVVPLRLADILQTSSQASRWYPLDGGIGYGRIRISLLFRSVEARLPPNLLGWDVGTFEIVSDRITLHNYGNRHAKLKLRTSGASSSVGRSHYHQLESQDGAYFDLSEERIKRKCRMPVKHRYRSAIIFDLQDGTGGYAVLWLQELLDNEESSIDIPIWTTKNGNRLTQNYITEENWEQIRSPGLEDLTQVGRLQFTGRFSAGLDEAHESHIDDNNARDTYETWEECVAEGVRDRHVSMELPETVRELHEKSLAQQRDILRQASSDERMRLLENESDFDWSKMFEGDQDLFEDEQEQEQDGGHMRDDQQHEIAEDMARAATRTRGLSMASKDSPSTRRSADSQSKREGNEGNEGTQSSKSNKSQTPSHDTQTDDTGERSAITDEGQDDEDSGIGVGNSSTGGIDYETAEEREKRLGERANKRSEHRKQRGVMQWSPARNAAFAKDQAAFAGKKVKRKLLGDLKGREPDIETETG